jgi:ornithine carbamoyltransferase
MFDFSKIKNFRGRDFITTRAFSREEIDYLIDLAVELKQLRELEIEFLPLRGKTIGMLFRKPSTRTRSSFEVGIAELGGIPFYFRPDEMQLTRGEPVKDTARVLDRYLKGFVIRTFGQDEVEEFAKYMKVPVINALTDLEHPCQVLADLMTIREKKGRWDGLRVVYTGDIWNVAHSLIVEAPRHGMDFIIAVPKGYEPNEEIWKFAEQEARKRGTRLEIVHDLNEAVKGADVVIANTWWSMGKPEQEKDKRKEDFKPFTVTPSHMELAKPDVIFMHCLPAYRGNEMTEEVIEGKWSVVFDEAENRLHTEKAVLTAVIP